MIRKNPHGDLPQIHPDAFVDPTAIICGLVVVEEKVFIGPYAVIRADEINASEFSEDVARTNNEFVLGYKRIQNEF